MVSNLVSSMQNILLDRPEGPGSLVRQVVHLRADLAGAKEELKEEKLKRGRMRGFIELQKRQLLGCEEKSSGYENQLNALETRHAETLQLLETRTVELRAAQTFLSTEDSRSASDVVQLVQDLNSEILQASAQLVESLPLKLIFDVDRDARRNARDVVSELIGPLAANMLESSRGEEDIDLLEVGVRGVMVLWACKIIQTWHFGASSRSASQFDDLYKVISSAGGHFFDAYPCRGLINCFMQRNNL